MIEEIFISDTPSAMKRIYQNTQISTLDRKDIVRIGNMAVTWCRQNLGVNNRKQFQIRCWFTRWADDPNVCGEYDDETNEIFIFYRNCKDVREMLDTIIHEWTHQLQPMRTKYFKYKGSYKKNPFEVEAFAAETLYRPVLWDSIRHRVNTGRRK